MTYFYYKTNTWNSQPQITEEAVKMWEHLSEKKNFSFNADEVLSLINDKTRLIIINNPQNPTGGLIE